MNNSDKKIDDTMSNKDNLPEDVAIHDDENEQKGHFDTDVEAKEEAKEEIKEEAKEKEIPIMVSEDDKSDTPISVDTNVSKEHRKKFSLGKFLAKWIFILLLIFVIIAGIYLRFSQINSMQYQSGVDNSFIPQLFKVQESEELYEAKISTTNFNKLIADAKEHLELPFNLRASNVFYDSAKSNIIVNVDNDFISTSLILNAEYLDDKLYITDMKLGFLGIPFYIGNSFMRFDAIYEQINQSHLVDIQEVNLSTDGVYIKYKLHEKSVENIKDALSRLQRENIREYSKIKNNAELSKILYFSKKINDKKHEISDRDFILRFLADKEFCIQVLSTLDRSSVNKFLDTVREELGFELVLDESYFSEILDISDYRHAYYMKDLEVHKLMDSLKNQLESYEQIKEEKKNLVEKLDIYMIPEVATWNSIIASSSHRDDEGAYYAGNMDDNDDDTYWATAQNNGIGETITFESASSYDIAKLKIKNGILSDKDYYDNNRIQRLLLEFSNGTSKIIELDDKNNDYQEFSINEENIVWIKATILKIKQGRLQDNDSKKPLTGITEIHFELKKLL